MRQRFWPTTIRHTCRSIVRFLHPRMTRTDIHDCRIFLIGSLLAAKPCASRVAGPISALRFSSPPDRFAATPATGGSAPVQHDLEPGRDRARLSRCAGVGDRGLVEPEFPRLRDPAQRAALAGASTTSMRSITIAAANGADAPSCAPGNGNSRFGAPRIASPEASIAAASSRSIPVNRKAGRSS